MKLVKESLFEADLNLPKEYLEKINKEAKSSYGFSGPSPQEFIQMVELLNKIMSIQRGHEEELTELGKKIIKKFYGTIIEDVELDIKIVGPDDKEKLEMAQKAEAPPQINPKLPKKFPGIEHDVDKRKLINNIMQGEAQNVHSMMYDAKPYITKITGNDKLLDYYMKFLEINKKFDWDEKSNLPASMKGHPEMANMVEVDFDDEGEEGESKPRIKVRALDLPLLIHETVKGIYELIATGAIDADADRAQEVMKATDTLADEQEDIKYGPYIAKDIRDFVNTVIDEVSGANSIENMREFIFGELIKIPAEEFVKLITLIIQKDEKAKPVIKKIINKILEEFKSYNEKVKQSQEEPEEPEEENELINYMRAKPVSKPKPEPKQEPKPEETKKPKKWVELGLGALNFELNKAIDNEDWETAKEIQQMIERKGGMKESFLRKFK